MYDRSFLIRLVNYKMPFGQFEGRYSIHVSDEIDGESRFGEINPSEVLLEVEYLSSISDQINIVRSEYENTGEHITEGSSGNWGDFPMPPHDSITIEEAIEMAAYILKQGSREKRWLYSGLEGIFRIIEKPESVDSGIYKLTASYINSGRESESGSGIRGEHFIFLNIE